MELTLERKYKKKSYTIGKMYIDGAYFCDTLEDTVRDIAKDGTGKIHGVTAIPAGTYKVTLSYSPKFKRVLPYLEDVPHFSGIRIHSGNTAADTEGCILVGRNTAVGRLSESRHMEQKLTDILTKAAKIEAVTITIE